MFAGELVIPSIVAVLVTASGSYALAYSAVGVAGAGAGLLLATGRRFSRT